MPGLDDTLCLKKLSIFVFCMVLLAHMSMFADNALLGGGLGFGLGFGLENIEKSKESRDKCKSGFCPLFFLAS